MTLLQFIIIIIIIISRKLFYVLWNQWDFLRNEHIQAGTATFLLTVTETKKKNNNNQTVTSTPRYVLNRDFCETFHPQKYS